MSSRPMRQVKYTIKLLRYATTLIHIILFYRFLPELTGPFMPGWGTLEALVAGLLSGFVTIYLNENRTRDMRTDWKPQADLETSRFWGFAWDAVRLPGDAIAVPVEEELFYHSWFYRFLVKLLSFEGAGGILGGFTAVGLKEWNWIAWAVSGVVYGGSKGKEWRGYMVLGVVSRWAGCRDGQFWDGFIARAVRNTTVCLWALVTGQRQYL